MVHDLFIIATFVHLAKTFFAFSRLFWNVYGVKTKMVYFLDDRRTAALCWKNGGCVKPSMMLQLPFGRKQTAGTVRIAFWLL